VSPNRAADPDLESQLRAACAELERRLRAAAPCRAEDLFAAFPSLAADTDAALELIYTEFVLREELGQHPSPAEWQDRFPQWQADLRQLFQVHRFVGDDPNGATTAAEAPPARGPGPGAGGRRRLGSYELLEEVGRGGMGVVYKARQAGLNRVVALKLILAGEHAGDRDLARFRREAEAAAQLQHPNIVQIHEVGEADGQPYLVLEYVDGGSLAQRLIGGPLSPRQAAEVVQTLARAVHHAHQRGVVHRDLKPANVLLAAGGFAEEDAPTGRPQAAWVPKIADFGLAKQLESGSDLTQSGVMLGTPSYMAPEQAAGRNQDVGPATDLYALGAILYELLTGRPPFQAASPLDTLEQVRGQEPVPVRRLQPKVPRDLDTICLKCLRKELPGRYASALALADDLRRFLAGEPIRARPVSRPERLARWCRRNPVPAALGAAVLLVLATGAAGVTWKWLDAERERQRAVDYAHARDTALREAEVNLYLHRIPLAQREWLANRVGRAEQLLGECPRDLRRWEWHYLERQCQTAELLALRERTGWVNCVAFSPDGSRLAAAAGGGGTATIWDAATGREVRTFDGLADWVSGLAFSPDGRRLATVSMNLRFGAPAKPGKPLQPGGLRVWDVATGEEVAALRRPRPLLGYVAFSPDGKHLTAAARGGKLWVWDAATGREVLPRLGGDGQSFAYSPDGRYLARPGADRVVRVWDPATGREVRACRGHTGDVVSVAFSPDGRLASAGRDRTVRLWDVATGQEVLTLVAGTDVADAGLAFSPDGRRLASGGAGGTVLLWDATTGQPLATIRGGSPTALSIVLSPDGRQLAWATWEPTVKVWDATRDPEARTLYRGQRAGGIALGPGDRPLAAAGTGTTVRLWEAATGEERFTLPGHTRNVTGVAFRPDGRRLASAGWDGAVKVWDAGTGKQLLDLPHARGVSQVAYSPDGTLLASAGQDATVVLWDAEGGRQLAVLRGHTGEVASVAFRPGGAQLASAGWDGRVRVWDVRTFQEVRTLPGHAEGVSGVAYSPDGQRLASAGLDRAVRLWDATTGHEVRLLRGHIDRVTSVAFSPDGERLASAGRDGLVKLWDAATGQELLSLRGHDGPVTGLAFGADGRWLLSASADGTVKVWDGTPRDEGPGRAAARP
jgi:WD40 repeat protein/tRNA A-37 threonylcarbamoyl transferase component Bud32